MFKKSLVAIQLVSALGLMVSQAQPALPHDAAIESGPVKNPALHSLLNLSATDALGRRFDAAAGIKEEKKYAGLFYSLWLGQHRSGQKGIYDIQKLLDTNPDALKNVKGVPESPLHEFHFWGEPLYGYYSMSDPWIVTRHIELLSNAGIDYLCIDATNRVVYTESIKNLLTTLLRIMDQGIEVPKIVFYTNSLSGTTVDDLYNQFYKSGEYDRAWFKPSGKPVIIGITENNGKASDMTKYHQFTDFIKPAMKEYFDVRESQWPNGDYNPVSIPWMSWQYPQWNHNGTVAVPVAQHSHSAIAASVMHPESSRGYNNITKKVEQNWMAGANFQTMWDAVFASREKINNVLITSFNEWMAIKYANSNELNGVYFVDVYNHEFSRDIEMMKGGYQDNFYLQLVKNVRKFKLSGVANNRYPMKTVKIRRANEKTWGGVGAVYIDLRGDAIPRNFTNAAGTGVYTDSSNRNDITEIRVAHDRKHVYFMIKTATDITEHNGTDLNWMNILVSGDSTKPSFAGYTYILNRKPGKNGKTSVERSLGGYNWTDAGNAQYTIKGNLMQVAVPLKALGLTADNCSFGFKASDNVTDYHDIMDYYITGDSAPIGRMNFNYQ